MVSIKRSKEFKKHYKLRILPHKKLREKYKDRLEIFVQDRKDPALRDHKLKGRSEGIRAFSITGDIRVIYFERAENYYVFLDIGTHPQIYGM